MFLTILTFLCKFLNIFFYMHKNCIIFFLDFMYSIGFSTFYYSILK